ncbi:TVP38/TMEM64 family protein [Paenibacillus sp. PR3]|uniref:TVP38/TMEM64 family membrane protein n=1 Tax=Paenibacillus terricola TaxID=2763503 RepID=A0ABR8MT03_9BACL|nr:VTT domain-containing protein [Paenibacillus terricola]MBD3919108.1 TVP38/TMEM64 family protein [Paenibacillus terricola]
MKKWLLSISYTLTVLFLLLNKEHLLEWIQQKESANIFLIQIIAILLALIPIAPFGLIAGVIGAKLGFVVGGVINIVASTSAALIMFVVVRYTFSSSVRSIISRYKSIDHLTKLFETNPFLTVFFARVIPIIPAPLVNMYSAITRIPFFTFFLATVVGKLPIMITFALLGEQLFTNTKNAIITIALYSAFLLLIYLSFRIWSKKKGMR